MEEETKVETSTEETTNESTEQTGTKLSAETLLVQKEKFRERAEKAEALLAEKTKTETKTETKGADNGLEDRLAVLELSKANPTLDAETINNVFKLAKAEGKTPNDMLDNPMVKAYIEKKDQEAKNQAAMPTNNRSSIATGDKPRSEMTREERKASFDKLYNNG